MEHLRRARQHLQSFLLRQGRIFTGRTAWTKAHTVWLCKQKFDHPAQHIVLEEYRQTIEDAKIRLERLTRPVTEVASQWSMARDQSLPGITWCGSADGGNVCLGDR
jgi:transposase